MSADPSLTPFGDFEVFWQAPIWTDGCIQSFTGVYADSSASTPAMYGLASLISGGAGVDLPAIEQFSSDMALGATRLKTLGIRYYMTQQSGVNAPGLTEIESSGAWRLYEVVDSSVAADVGSQPVVVEPGQSTAQWTQLTMRYQQSASFDVIPLVQRGPDRWPRAAPDVEPPSTSVASAGVRDVVSTGDSVSFDVAKLDVPVVVRVSEYPGWTVDGAPEVLRASPNFLVVVPRQTHITMRHERTPLDMAAICSGLVGLVMLGYLAATGRSRSRRR
jgi:hypothetical protein